MSGSEQRRGFWSRLRGRRQQQAASTRPAGGLNDQPAGLVLPSSLRLPADVEEALRDLLWEDVLLGRTEVEDLLELREDEIAELGVTEQQAVDAFRHLVRARREQQAAWSADVARPPLLAAFDDLEAIGVLARPDFTCCGSCATAEIGDERDDSRRWRGYVYFHQQDTETLLETRTTYLGYGVFLAEHLPREEWEALDDAEKDATYARLVGALVSDEVLPVLRRHGLRASWDGDTGTRILLEDVDHYVAV
ncbi:MAG: hypothetical protein NTV28_10740 [Propionibacteriales bacterium]|nr:hypothetical protein [Propionibacteriales bacterium]